MANYNIENFYSYEKKEWPFYEIIGDKLKLFEDYFYNLFRDYIMFFGKERKEFFADVKDYNSIIEYMTSRKYYWRCLAFSGIFWFPWSISYFDFNSEFVDKSAFSYFNYVLDRLKTYNLAKEIIEKNRNEN